MAVLAYLRFELDEGADLDEFERDMHAALDLARVQPGFRWTDMAVSMTVPGVYVVVGSWETVDQIRAWEHVPEHEALYDKWEPFYRKPLTHQRFVAWLPEGPPGEGAPGTET